ncbi:MAG: DUF3383 domain-containing protein, partial [bacterium]|nr:DUF3383 domain-containing protein [bacterium]
AVGASQAKFSVPILLVDDSNIPVDRRYRTVTKSSYTTTLTAATDAYTWCAAVWGQNYNPAEAYIGRWISAATNSHAVCPDATQVASVYAALTTTAQLGVLEAGGSVVDITPDFTGDTTMANVAASIEAAMSGAVASYTCTVDALDRIVVTSDNSGSSAAAVTLQTPAAGVDLTGSAYLGTAFSVAGYDIEAQGTALAAILALDNTPYFVCERGGSIAQVTALSTVVNALSKQLCLVSNDSDAKDSGEVGDFCYAIEALSHQRTYQIYSEHTTHHPDAAVVGEVLQVAEGSRSFAFVPLSGVSESGLDPDGTTVISLTSTEQTALEGKGCDYLVAPANVTHLRNGLAAGGNEMRLMLAKDYFESNIQTDIYNWMVAQDVVVYDDDTVQTVKGFILRWAEELVNRKVLNRDSFAWNLPSAADFTAAQKATHTMTLNNVFTAEALSSVNDFVMTLSITI